MSTSNLLLLGILAPALVAGSWLAIAWRFRPDATDTRGCWGVPLALGTGYVVGHVGVVGRLPWPPVEATQWIAYLALPAMLIGWIECRHSANGGVSRWLLRGVMALLLAGVMLRPLIEYTYSPGQSAGVVFIVAGLVLAFGWTMGRAWVNGERPAGWFDLLIVSAGCAVTLALTGSLVLGQLAGAWAGAVGAAWVVSALSRGRQVPSAAIPVAGSVLSGLLVCGYFYSELPAASAILILIAPLCGRAVPRGALRGRGLSIRGLVRGAAVLVPIVLAAVWALYSAPPPATPYY